MVQVQRRRIFTKATFFMSSCHWHIFLHIPVRENPFLLFLAYIFPCHFYTPVKKGPRTGINSSTYFTWFSILSNFSGLFWEKKHPLCMRMNLKLFPFYGGGGILFLSSPYSIIWQWCRCFCDKSAEGFSEFLGSFF